MEHLAICPDCAVFAEAEQTLNRDLAMAAAENDDEDMALSKLRARIEARVDSNRPMNSKEISLMSAVINQIKRRPRLGLTFGVACVVLAAATLIPFSFEKTVGYEVAIAGVNKGLAMDSEKIQTLMTALGLENVQIDVSGCEATCNLKISDLENEGQVEIVIAAFDELGNCLLEKVDEVQNVESISLFEHARKVITFQKQRGIGGEEAHRIVLQALGHLDSATGGTFNVWMAGVSGNMIVHDDGKSDYDNQLDQTTGIKSGTLRLMLENSTAHIDSDKNSAEGTGRNSGTSTHRPEDWYRYLKIEKSASGGNMIAIVDENGESYTVDLTDPDFKERMKELGFDIQLTTRDDFDGLFYQITSEKDGGKSVSYYRAPDDAAFDFSVDKADLPPGLPEGLELKQNYPNPFNPTTMISFSLPTSEKVLLEIYNVSGQKIRTLIDAVMPAGEHSVDWDATDDSGEKVASGIYLYRLTSGDYTTSKKMTLLK